MNATEQHSVKAATTYVVLEEQRAAPATSDSTPSPPVWIKCMEVTARTAEQAIRQYAEKSGSTTALVLVAVPARSWQPVKVTPKTTTVLEIASA